jgi:endo-1,4-beta-D-glucanase Y
MEKENDNLFGKINKLTLPATILIASVIICGFIYASQLSKQKSIERQQQTELQAKAEQEDKKAQQATDEAFKKGLCVSEAMLSAQDQYKKTCSYACQEGYYYNANYDSYYKTCLQREGLE